MLRKILYKLKYKFHYFFENIIFNDRILYIKKKNNYKFFNSNNSWNKVAQNIKKQSSKKNKKSFFQSWSVISRLAPTDFILGYKILNKIKKNFLGEELLNKCSTPPWGSPVLLRKYPFLSTQTAAHLLNIISFYDCFGKKFLYYKLFIDFGGGYGGLARCLCQLRNHFFIHIVDLADMLGVQKTYINNTSNFRDRINFTSNIKNLNGRYDLFNASFSFSEISEKKRLNVENFILKKCDRFHITYQNKFNNIDNVKYMKNFQKKFRLKKWKVFIKPFNYYGSDNKFIIYGISPKHK